MAKKNPYSHTILLCILVLSEVSKPLYSLQVKGVIIVNPSPPGYGPDLKVSTVYLPRVERYYEFLSY